MKPGNPKGEKAFKAAQRYASNRWPYKPHVSDRLQLDLAFRFAFMEGVRYALKKL